MATHDDDDGARGWLARLRDRWRRRAAAGRGDRARPPSHSRRTWPEWALLESCHAAALASLYAQQLRRAGIPVMGREWGGGSALLGGVPVGMSLFVPEDRLAEARAILDAGVESDVRPNVGPNAMPNAVPDASAEGERP